MTEAGSLAEPLRRGTSSRFTPLQGVLEFAQSASPWIPIRIGYDFAVSSCDEVDDPFADHLGELDIPILHITAAGGAGRASLPTLDRIGSTDKEVLMVSFFSEEDAWHDFGHVDILAASQNGGDARSLIWQPLRDWLGRKMGREQVDHPEVAVEVPRP